MDSVAKSLTPPHWREGILIAVFVGFIWLPTLDSIFHFDFTPPPGENRLLAAFPKFSPGASGGKNYLAGLEAYFNDHFGCRKCLVLWQRQWRKGLFGDKAGLRSVIAGSSGWYYFAENQMVEHYRGVLQFTPEELRDWQVYLERLRDRLAQRGVKFVFVVAPDKQSIYSENLPAWLTKISNQTKLEQFYAYIKAHSTVPVVDLRPALRDARQSAPVYLQTDTHWNQFGAFVACQELVRGLAQQLPGLQPLTLDDFDRVNRPAPAGDLAAFAGITSPERNASFFTPKPSLPHLVITSSGSPLRPLAYVTETKNSAASGSVLVYHDSFGNYWIPFLGYHFGRVTYRANDHLESDFFDLAVVEREKPDVVIVELLERYFNVAKPRKLLAEEKP